LLDRAADILQKIPAESNRIVKRWNELGVKPKAAFDSQGLIELYNRYCLKRRCLDCSIGNALLKPQRV
jgi:hypothetical protein